MITGLTPECSWATRAAASETAIEESMRLTTLGSVELSTLMARIVGIDVWKVAVTGRSVR